MNFHKRVLRKFFLRPPYKNGYYSDILRFFVDLLYNFEKRDVSYQGIRQGEHGLYKIDTTEWMGWNVYMYGAYAQHLIDIFELYVKENDIVFDVGANQGFTSIPLSSLCGKQGHVYSFEINDIALDVLSENILINQIHNVTIVPKAVSNESAKGTLYSPSFGTGSLSGVGATNLSGLSSLSLPAEAYMKGVQFSEKECDIITLDSFIEKNKIERLNFIKLDIEGFDGKAIQGAAKTIEKFRPIILFEYDPVWLSRAEMTLGECLVLLKGYAFFEVVSDLKERVRPLSPEIINNPQWSGDILCLPKTSKSN